MPRLNKTIFFLLIVALTISIASCGNTISFYKKPAPASTVTPTCTPTFAAPPPRSPVRVIPPTRVPASATPAPTLSSDEISAHFLDVLPKAAESCLPDKTEDDIGVYIYDLNENRELVSINADVPFQFASSFKGPVLVYFLSQCKKYWDSESPEWNAYFLDREAARNIDRYVSDEYKALTSARLSDVNHWGDVDAFFAANRFASNGKEDLIDKRFFVLNQVYSMTTRSNNYATGELLKFIYEQCSPQTPPVVAESCRASNAISAFNQWFNRFAGIQYQDGEAQRGLFKWDVIIEKDADGKPYEAMMATYGLKDNCAVQLAQLNCVANSEGINAWTARDLFKFYNALYFMEDVRVRGAALAMLAIDNDGPARGNFKNLARKMGAVSASKNGHAHFAYGSISTDAGIFQYQGRSFVIVALAYDAQNSLSALYDSYARGGISLTEQGLMRDFLEEYVARQ